MQVTLAGLAATKDSGAPAILVAQAKPGVPERIRWSALGALTELKGAVKQDHQPELIETARSTLRDPFSPMQALEQLQRPVSNKP